MTKKVFSLSSSLPVSGPKGARTLKESADYCTRCNACAQSCPSYFFRQEEAYSPRGRNQIIRLLAERKIKFAENETLLKSVTNACFLCTRCTAACAGALPIADHMLALRRAAGWNFLPAPLKTLLRLYGTKPKLFRILAACLRLLRHAGLIRLMRISGCLHFSVLHWVKHADDVLPCGKPSLRSWLKKRHISPTPTRADIVYLPSFEAQYLNIDTATSTLALFKNKTPYILLDTPCGLFEYIYGKPALSLLQAKKLLSEWEKLSRGRGLSLVTDGIETYGFLKHFPILFTGQEAWAKRAETFATKVQFVTDLSSPRPAAPSTDGRAALENSSVLYPAEQPTAKARKILKTHFGKNFVECEYSRFVIPAGGLAFVRGAHVQETVLENIKDVARRQIRQVYCLSGLAALELDAALRRHYPQARARHIVQLQAEPWLNSRQIRQNYPPTRS